ncbi:MAG: tetratricopeptide repeat protein [Myxococcota bacterium]
MHQLLLLAALGSSAAHAAAVKPTGEAVVSGVVEVPLYAGLVGEDPFSYVEVTAGETRLFLRLATGHRELKLTEGAAAKLKLKPSGKEGEKTAKVKSLALGSVTLEGIKASITTVPGSGSLPVDGELGLPGFQELAFAIVPSAGVLRLATGPDGASLIAGIGGTPGPVLRSMNDKKVKVGDAEKETVKGGIYGIPVKWSGVEVTAGLAIEESATWLAREVEGVDWYTVANSEKVAVTLPAAPGVQVAEVRHEWRDIELGGVTRGAIVARKGQGPIWHFAGNAGVGHDVLGSMDLAIDPTSGAFAMKPAAASKKADYAPTLEASLRKALDAEPAADGTAPTEEQKVAARTAGSGALATFLEARGRLDEAIVLRKELTIAEADDCAIWTNYGSTLLAAGRPAEAIEPFTKASALYQPWAQLPLAERTDISEAHAAAEKKKEDWTGQVPQSHACHVAPGHLALAQLQTKNAAAVATLYPAQLDLDATLPLAAGNAALLAGNFDAAQAAYLQALKLGNGTGDDARVGLYLALAPKDFPAARKQLERLRLQYGGHTDPLLVRLYVEGVRQSQGAEGVKAGLDAMIAADPSDAVLLAQRGRERTAAGDTKGADEDWTAVKARFQDALATNPNDASTWASWAIVLAAAGDAAEAQKAADMAVKLAPASGMAWLAMADAATAAGDATKAGESRARAGMVWAQHPGYALLLAQ